MTVYVDDMRAKFGRMIMCHMIADTSEELIDMARKIGVDPKWIQHAGTGREHFDIALFKRTLAIGHGAVEITWRQTGAMVMRRRATGQLGQPEGSEDWQREHMRKRRAELVQQNADARAAFARGATCNGN